MNHFINCVTKKYATFQGRASRQEYWMYMLFYTIIGLFLMFIDVTVFGADMIEDHGVLNTLFIIANIIPGLAVTIRRLHDTNHSGHQFWWYFTIIGGFWILYLMVIRGDLGQNKYGG